MESIQLNCELLEPINCTDFDLTGEKSIERNKRIENDFAIFNSKLEEIKSKKKEEENEIIKLKNELDKGEINDEKRKEVEKKLNEFLAKQEKERKEFEIFKNEILKKEKDFMAKKRLIEEEARKKGISIDLLDNVIDKSNHFCIKGFTFLLTGLGLIAGALGIQFLGLPSIALAIATPAKLMSDIGYYLSFSSYCIGVGASFLKTLKK